MFNLTNLIIRRDLIHFFKIVNGYETINFKNNINFLEISPIILEDITNVLLEKI